MNKEDAEHRSNTCMPPKWPQIKYMYNLLKMQKNILTDMGDGGDSNTTMKYIHTKTPKQTEHTAELERNKLCSKHLRISTSKNTC